MRLIDADKLIEEIKQEIDMRYMYSPKGFINVINNQPTAFDLDRVMQELEDVKEQNEPRINNKTLERDIKIYKLTMNFAIKIVKAGVIDDN